MPRRSSLQKLLSLLCGLTLLFSFLPFSTAAAAPASKISVVFSSAPDSVATNAKPSVSIVYTTPSETAWSSIYLRIKNADGKGLAYESSWIGKQPGGAHTQQFTLDLAKYDLKPGLYTLDAEVRSKIGSGTETGSATRPLTVYVTGKAQTAVSFIARVQTVLLSNPDGTFSFDPAIHNEQQRSVKALCDAIIQNPSYRVTLAIAPAMLEEWNEIENGYTLVNDGEKTEVKTTDPTPVAYANTLLSLQDAVKTGRLFLTSEGYSDPDLAALRDANLANDTAVQHTLGDSVMSTLLTVAPQAGTVPPHLLIPGDAAAPLAKSKISWMVVQDTSAREDGRSVGSGAYKTSWQGAPVALLNDSKSTALISEKNRTGFLARVMSRYTATSEAPFIVTADISAGTDIKPIISAIDILTKQPWVKLTTPDESAKSATKTVSLTEPPARPSPQGFWEAVQAAREDTNALEAITPSGEKVTSEAVRLSLLAESNAWAGADNNWESADRGLADAKAASAKAKSVLDKISLNIEPVTLAKNEGNVPLVISNGTSIPLNVTIATDPEDGLTVKGASRRPITLRPNDNYMTLSVKLDDNVAKRNLLVRVKAGSKTVTEQDVTVSSSAINRAFLLGGIAILLVAILWYIRRRVRSVEHTK